MNSADKPLVAVARKALWEQVKQKTLSYSSYGTIIDRMRVFANYIYENEPDIKVFQINRNHLVEFGKTLTEFEPSYSQNLISSMNSGMTAIRQGQWKSVSPTLECGITRRDNIRKTPPTGMDIEIFDTAINDLIEKELIRGAAIARTCLHLGLREKEASLLNYQSALQQAKDDGSVKVIYGTKGGRPREVPITCPEIQISVLEYGADIQGGHFSIIPESKTWKQFRDSEIKKTRDVLKVNGIANLKDLRACYGCNRYKDIIGILAPVLGGQAPKEEDLRARMIISLELGHNRTDILNSYIGRRAHEK